MDQETKGAFRKWSLTFVSGAFAIALAMLYTLVLRSIAVQITPPSPLMQEPYPDVSTQELCEQAGGRWLASQTDTTYPEARPQPVKETNFCQGPLKFERDRDIQNEASQQTSLFVFAIGGGIAVALSLLVAMLRPIAPGLMIGGIVSFFIAGIHIWTLAPGIGRLITIIIIFLFLTGIGLYVFKEKTPDV